MGWDGMELGHSAHVGVLSAFLEYPRPTSDAFIELAFFTRYIERSM